RGRGGAERGQTLRARALWQEPSLRLVAAKDVKPGNSRGHFFGAAGEAMRRILVENARRKHRIKHGGTRRRVALNEAVLSMDGPADELLAVDEALERLAAEEPQAAELGQLH